MEGLQVIPAIFSSLILIVTYSILKEVNINRWYKILVITVMAFHPTFIILAGSINNDILMIFLEFVIIIRLIKWKQKPSYPNIIFLAIATGLAVMSKISAAIMAIPIIYTFLHVYKLEYEKDEKIINKKWITQMLIFGAISLPIGLWHSVRNYMLFSQPLRICAHSISRLQCC